MTDALPLPTPWREVWRRFSRQRLAVAAAGLLLMVMLAALLAPVLAPFDPAAPDYAHALEGPGLRHWAGTDEFGRDVFSRLLHGAGLSLGIGLAAVSLGTAAGMLLGLVAGFYGGWTDQLVMRFCDVLLAFPGLLLAIGLVAILGPGMGNVIWAVALFTVPVIARLVRATTLALNRTAYVDAARAMGVPDRVLMLRHILPGTLASVVVYVSLRIGTSILTAASLSFLGLGAAPPSPEWGAMLASGRSYIGVADHLTLLPGLAIFLTVLAFNLLGDGLRDAFDPRLGQDL